MVRVSQIRLPLLFLLAGAINLTEKNPEATLAGARRNPALEQRKEPRSHAGPRLSSIRSPLSSSM